MTASTEQYPRPQSTPSTDPTPSNDPATGRLHTAPPAAVPAEGSVEGRAARARRVVSMKVAAIIGIVAFLLGAGLALLIGGLTGPGGTPPTGGPGGAPGTSQSSTQSSDQSSTGT